MVGPTKSRREFMRSVVFDGGTDTIVAANTDNIVFLDDAIATAQWVRIGTETARSGNPYENDTSIGPEWLIDPKPVAYPPNRAQRRAMKKGKNRGSR